MVTGTSRSSQTKPIMGPPMSSRRNRGLKPPACSMRSRMGTPMGTSRLRGWPTPRPVRVTMREIRGLPSKAASAMAATVAMFWQTMPIWAGISRLGTSWPVRMRMSCFSPPEGCLLYTSRCV